MNHESVFSMVGILSMTGWLALLVSPYMPRWSDRVASLIVPAMLAVVYAVVSLTAPMEHAGGFGTFADVTVLFSNPGALLAGWIHFLAFDLVVGAWICRTARNEGIRFRWVLPCLPTTFLLGPLGFLLFLMVLTVHRLGSRTAAG